MAMEVCFWVLSYAPLVYVAVFGQHHYVFITLALQQSLNLDIVTPVFFLLRITLAVFSVSV